MKNLILTVVILLVISGNTACAAVYMPPADGNVLPVGAYTTVQNVVNVVRGTAPGGGIYVNAENDAYMFYGQMTENQWWFWAISNKGGGVQPVSIIANRTNCLTFVDLLTGLTDEGWRDAYAADLPDWLKPIVESTAAMFAWASKILVSFPVFVILPGGDLSSPIQTIQD